MILRRYRCLCSTCRTGHLVLRDVPSQSTINNYLPPTARRPIPPGDRWRYAIVEPCSHCSAAPELDRLPGDAVALP